MHELVELYGNFLQEVGFGLVLPVGLLHGAAAQSVRRVRAPGLVGAEFTVRLVGLRERFADLEIHQFRIAGILQDQGLRPIADNDPGFPGDFDVSHLISSLS
jgi:hypothetical protein